jgi:glucose/arabinose dehydrogenase
MLLTAVVGRIDQVSAADLLQGVIPTATPAPAPVAPAGPTVQVVTPTNVRSGPGTTYRVLAVAQPGASFDVTGKNAAGTWWQIDYNGGAAWLFADLVEAEAVEDVAIVAAPAAQPAQPAQPAAGGSAAGSAASSQTPRVNFNPQAVQFKLETVFSGLGQPTFVTNAGDGSGRLFVLERAGRIKVFAEPDSDGRVFLDIEDRVDDSGPEQGLLGLAFAPDYAASGLFYVNYTDNAGDTVVARYRVSDDPNRADKESERQLLWVDQPAPNHNGGMLVFGPDGRLWVGMGDGGGANDTFGNGQRTDTLLGKIVRLDVSGDSATSEIWATGLRNPWRFSFDRRTGDLWIADVGQDLFEEINFVPAAQVGAGGLNFGWPIMEGAHCRGNEACDTSPYVQPVFEYGHAGNGCSITGGHVYRGQAQPALQGVYFYADFCSGNIWAWWRGSDGKMQNAKILPNAAAVASFGEDESGELYVADFGGFVHRLTATTP